MKNTFLFGSNRGGMVLLGVLLFASSAVAGESSGAEPAPLKNMNQAEYESYREQLRQHGNGVPPAVSEQKTPAGETKQLEQGSGRSGYGQGYHARAERNGRPESGGHRGGMMGRGAGQMRR